MNIHHIEFDTATRKSPSNRISIITTTENGRRSYTVQFTDGIIITTRTGRSIIINTIRTYFQHRMNQRAAVPSARIIRFRRRVDGMEGGAI